MTPPPSPRPNTLWRYVGGGAAHGSIQRVILSDVHEVVSVHEFAGFALLRGGPQWSYLGDVAEFLLNFRFLGNMPAPYSAGRKSY